MNERTMKRWLAASVLVNLFLVAGIAGAAWRWTSWTDAGKAPAAAQARGLRFAADELAPEQRKEFRRGLRTARRAAAQSVQAAREGRQEALRLMGAEQFDRQAVEAALARTREADLAVRARVETAVVEFAATLPPDERRKLADGLQRRSNLASAPAPASAAAPQK